MTAQARAGFSLVEALVVLAITSVLLILLVSVSTGARRAGFRSAARADALQDRLVGEAALRVLIRAVRLPEAGRSAAPFDGDPDGFTAAVVPGRATPCGVGAPSAALSLRLDRSGGRTRLTCAGADGRAAVLLDMGPSAAAFSYALAGRDWSDRLSAALPPTRAGASAPRPRPRLWIRLAASPGPEVVEAVDPPAGASSPASTAGSATPGAPPPGVAT